MVGVGSSPTTAQNLFLILICIQEKVSICSKRLHFLRKRDNWLTGKGEKGMDEEPNYTTPRKYGPLKIIQYVLADRYLSV
jgi:hypothetical protein